MFPSGVLSDRPASSPLLNGLTSMNVNCGSRSLSAPHDSRWTRSISLSEIVQFDSESHFSLERPVMEGCHFIVGWLWVFGFFCWVGWGAGGCVFFLCWGVVALGGFLLFLFFVGGFCGGFGLGWGGVWGVGGSGWGLFFLGRVLGYVLRSGQLSRGSNLPPGLLHLTSYP